MTESGQLQSVRRKQHKIWMWNQIRDHVIDLFRNHPTVKSHIPQLEKEVASGAITPGHAADILLREFTGSAS